ncbi:IS66 family insertion sequence element accessory protein TnpB [Sorangium sp. So ce136]|uniref:IS66 family insertion sequence element accessory protein TnpB n=1 Tax=Sorangium sp. So ce136 TaxID=3133284 RepID=UPI003F5225AD
MALRWSFDILAGSVRDQLAGDSKGGVSFVFLRLRPDRAKVLFYDRSACCPLCKRLERSRHARVRARHPILTQIARQFVRVPHLGAPDDAPGGAIAARRIDAAAAGGSPNEE